MRMIVDLQYGSTGKGLIAGYLAEKYRPACVISANMPNAGHTYIDSKGGKYINKVLPNGFVSPAIEWVLIGPGAVFDRQQLMTEYRWARQCGHKFRVGIHANAVRLTDDHRLAEADFVDAIGSTAQGSAMGLIHKMYRNPDNNPTWGAVEHPNFNGCNIEVVSPARYQDILSKYWGVLHVEGAQGFSLGINEQFYPFCTSRNCTVPALVDAVALPWSMAKAMHVIGTCRLFPIRVGGNSGPCYDDQEEITWEDLGVTPEKTTVTNRERRVFTFSHQQIRDALHANHPHSVFLNFCNYDRTPDHALVQATVHAINAANSISAVAWTGWGPTYHDVKRL